MDGEERFTESERLQELIEQAKKYKIENQPMDGEMSKAEFRKQTGMTKHEVDSYIDMLEKQGKIKTRLSANGLHIFIKVVDTIATS